MTIRDRRSGDDRRTLERFKVNIEIEWEGLAGRKPGTISDLSVVGCFVLCSGEVEDGENVKIYFPFADGRQIVFWGEVSNHVFEIGFGVCFVKLTEPQKEFLEIFVDILRDD